MAIPDYATLMLPVLRKCAQGVVVVRDITAGIADEFGLTEEERRQELTSGASFVLPSRIAWAKTYLKQAGLISQPRRGEIEITADGRALLATGVAAITIAILERYPSFVEFKNRRRTDPSVPAELPTQSAPARACRQLGTSGAAQTSIHRRSVDPELTDAPLWPSR